MVLEVKNSPANAGDLRERSALVAQRLKRLPAIRETWVRSLGLEDSLEKEMATHSSILAMDGGDSPRTHKESDTTEQLHLREGGWVLEPRRCLAGERGNPLQCSCPENSGDRGAWWATVHGVTKCRTHLSDLACMHG